MLNKRFQLSTTSIDTHKKSLPAIETRQVAGLDITLATPRKVSFDSHHECRNMNRSRLRNDSPTPPVCSLQSALCVQSAICTLYTPIGIAFDNSEKADLLLLENNLIPKYVY